MGELFQGLDWLLGLGGSRADVLWLFRESGSASSVALGVLVQVVTNANAPQPGAEWLRQVGVEPLLDPDRFGATVRRAGGTTLVVVPVPPEHASGLKVLAVLSMGSAAAADTDGGLNGFVSCLGPVLEWARPVTFVTGSFSRGAREYAPGAVLGDLVRRHVTRFVCRESVINLADPFAPHMWAMLTMMSAMEREQILSRLAGGSLEAALRRGSPWTSQQIPPGVRLFPDGVFRFDPAQVPLAEMMCRLLADSVNYRWVDVTRELDRLCVMKSWQNPAKDGWSSVLDPRRGREHEAAPTIGACTNPTVQAQALARWLPFWRSGRVDVEVPVALPVAKLGPFDVLQRAPKRGQFYVFPVQLELPDGKPFVAEELLDAAAAGVAARRVARPVGSQRTEESMPLLGTAQWMAGGREWVVRASARADAPTYEVRSREPVLAGPGPDGSLARFGWYYPNQGPVGATEATVAAGVLHRAVGEAIVAALTVGVQGRLDGSAAFRALLAPGNQDRPETPAEAVRRPEDLVATEVKAAHKCDKMLREIDDDEDPDREAALADASKAAWAGVKRAKASLAGLRAVRAGADVGVAPVAPAVPVVLAGEGDLLIWALRLLTGGKPRLPRAASQAVRQILHDLTLTPRPGGLWADFTVCVDVPADGGVLTLGPVQGVVALLSPHRRFREPAPGTARTGRGGGSYPVERAVAETDALLLDGLPMSEIVRGNATNGGQVRNRVRRYLVELGLNRGAASALTLNACPEARAAVYLMAQGRHPGIASELARVLSETYLVATWSGARGWKDNSTRREALLRVVAGGPVRYGTLRGADGAAPDLTSVARPGGHMTPGRHTPAPVQVSDAARPDDPAAIWAGTHRGDRVPVKDTWWVRAVPCPHPGCGGLCDVVALFPETPAGLLCRVCMRQPVAGYEGDAVFPEGYRIDSHGYDSWLRAAAGDLEARRVQRHEDAAVGRAEATSRGVDVQSGVADPGCPSPSRRS